MPRSLRHASLLAFALAAAAAAAGQTHAAVTRVDDRVNGIGKATGVTFATHERIR